MALGGIDIGTSGCKCTVMNTKGKILASAYKEYTFSRTSKKHEIAPEIIWETVKEVIVKTTQGFDELLSALCVSSFGESFVLLDKNGKELGPVILYTDPRGSKQIKKLSEKFGKGEEGERKIFEITGHRPDSMYTLSKLMYLMEENSDVYEKVAHILPIHSYIVYKLSGKFVTDYSLAARTMMLDIRELTWSQEIIKAANIDENILPQLAEAGTAVGNIKANVRSQLNISKNCQIVIGCHDQVAACIGSGKITSGIAVNGSGTVECITPMFSEIPKNYKQMFDSHYAIVPALNGYYVTYAFIFTGGALIQWYRNNFASHLKSAAQKKDISIYALLDSRVKNTPSDLFVLPHFAGAATPYMDSESKGAILGLTLENTEFDIYKAILEGIAYESKINLIQLEKCGISIEKLISTGGGSRSEIWTQIKSDVLNKPIDVLKEKEAGTVGSLILAGLATGEYRSLDQVNYLTEVVSTKYPSENKSQYDKCFNKYKNIYKTIKTVNN